MSEENQDNYLKLYNRFQDLCDLNDEDIEKVRQQNSANGTFTTYLEKKVCI